MIWMNYSLTPAIISFIAIVSYGLFHLLMDLRKRKSRLQIFAIKYPFVYSIERIKDLIVRLDFPVEVDFVVGHLGNKPYTFITVNDKDMKKMKEKLLSLFPAEKVAESDGHLTIYKNGLYDARHIMLDIDGFKEFDLGMLNFGSVTEIGESLIYRFTKIGERIKVESVFSAMSEEHLRNIALDVEDVFYGLNLSRPKDTTDFINHFNYHKLQ